MVSKEELKHKLSRELFIEIHLDGIIAEITSNSVEILGYRKEEMVGKDLNIFLENKLDFRIFLNSKDKKPLLIEFRHKNSFTIYMDARWDIFINEDKSKCVILSMIDVTECKEREKKTERIMKIFEKSKDIIYSFRIKPKIRFEYLSPAIYDMLGYTIEEHIQNPMLPFQIIHPDDYDMEISLATGKVDYTKPTEVRFKHKDGHYIWCENLTVPVYDENGEFIGVDGICRNIQERKKLEEKLIYLSYHDALTGFYNRTYFDKEKEKLDKQINVPIGIILCDLDNLKVVNDTLGHDTGDKLLKLVSELIKNNISENAVAARIGGDEFIILMENIDYKEVENTVVRLKNVLRNYNSTNPEISVEMSIGFAYSKNSVGCISKVFKEADVSMYIDKRKNKLADRCYDF